MEREYKNLGYFFLILLVFILVGFFKTYFGLFPHFDENTNIIVHIHATVLTLWVILLVVQPILIRQQKFSTHRFLGKCTYFLVPLIIFSFFAMMSKQYNEGLVQKMADSENLKGLYVPFGQLILFTTFYILAIIHKRNIGFHMRYMISTALVLIGPALARVAFFWFDIGVFQSVLLSFLFGDFILVGLILLDRTKKLNFKPYIVTLTLFLIFHIIWFILWHPN